jgi:hypothetical protein
MPPLQLVTDKLRSYPAAHRDVFPSVTHRTGQYELKSLTSTPGNGNGKCTVSNRQSTGPTISLSP